MPVKRDWTWSDVFATAAKWPELRVYKWKKWRAWTHKNHTAALSMSLKQLREDATRAKVVTLTPDLVWAVSKLSVELDPQYLTEQMIVARMPYEHTLFEWRGRDREDAYNALRVRQDVFEHPDEDHPATLVTTDPRGAKLLQFVSYEEKKRQLVFYPLEIHTTLPGDVRLPDSNAFRKVLEHCGVPISYVAHYLFSSDVVAKHPAIQNIVNDPRVDVLCRGPLFIDALDIRDPVNRVKMLMTGTSGDFRWHAALFMLLNRPNLIRYVAAAPPDPDGAPRPAGKPAKARDYRQAVLLLPKEQVVRRMLAAAERDRKKPGEHTVEGHWNYPKRTRASNCWPHKWPDQNTRREQCLLCGAIRWRTKEHPRGKGPVLYDKKQGRRADYSGVSLERLTQQIKLEYEGNDNGGSEVA